MKLSEAIEFFIHNYFTGKKLSAKTHRQYKNELDKFSKFLEKHEISNSIKDIDIKTIDLYFNKRGQDRSQSRLNAIASHLRCFFTFLMQEHIVDNDPTLFLKYMPWAKNKLPKTDLLLQINSIDHTFHDLTKVDKITEKLDKVRQEILRLNEGEIFSDLTLQENCHNDLLKIQISLKEKLNKNLDELLWTGTVIQSNDLTTWEDTLSRIMENMKKIGREQYKTNTVFESRKEKEWELFNELKRRLNRNEQLLEKVVEFKNESSTNLIKELLPVADGLDEAITALTTSTNDNKSKGLFEKIFSKNSSPTNFNQWSQGLIIIRERLTQILKNADVIEIESIGKIFNPNEHIAIAIEERNDIEQDIIIKEHLKGYRLNSEVIRLAEVIVAKKI